MPGFFRDVEQLFAKRLRIIAQAFQIILEAGDDVGQAVESCQPGCPGSSSRCSRMKWLQVSIRLAARLNGIIANAPRTWVSSAGRGCKC